MCHTMLMNNYKAAWQLYNFLVIKNKNNESNRKQSRKEFENISFLIKHGPFTIIYTFKFMCCYSY